MHKKAFICTYIILFSLLATSLLSAQDTLIQESEVYVRQREEMLKLLKERIPGMNSQLENAFRNVHRQDYIPYDFRNFSYALMPVPSGNELIIPSPMDVALMLNTANIQRDDSVLLIGKGSAYTAALISEITDNLTIIDSGILFVPKNARTFSSISQLLASTRSTYDVILFHQAQSQLDPVLFQRLNIRGICIVPLQSPSGLQFMTQFVKTDSGLSLKVIGEVYFTDAD